jgi:signal transduction histidine kinase
VSESSGAVRIPVVGRIVLASILAVGLVAAALSLTVWSYRDALAAHNLARAAVYKRSYSRAAETHLARERSVMNEYLFNPLDHVQGEIKTNQLGFVSNLSKVGVGEPAESALVQRAVAANERFLANFATSVRIGDGNFQASRREELVLDRAEETVLVPLRALRSLNTRYEQRVVASSDASSHRALLFAIVAGALAIAGGIGFALHALGLVRRIGSRNDRLTELDRMKDDFVASVSHELRTPLTSIRGYLELLREGEAGELTGAQHEFVAIVERNADRLLRLVGDLLFVAQVEAGKITLDPGLTDIEELVRQAVDTARPAATEKGIAVDLDLAVDGVSELHADRARLGQVLDNLISNALKFTQTGGHVTVPTSQDADAIVIEVSDDGMGMSPADVNRLFERFFRTASATKQAIQGTGLGLAIVKAIVEAHDGVITVRSIAGAGTVFRVELPRSLELAAA